MQMYRVIPPRKRANWKHTHKPQLLASIDSLEQRAEIVKFNWLESTSSIVKYKIYLPDKTLFFFLLPIIALKLVSCAYFD